MYLPQSLNGELEYNLEPLRLRTEHLIDAICGQRDYFDRSTCANRVVSRCGGYRAASRRAGEPRGRTLHWHFLRLEGAAWRLGACEVSNSALPCKPRGFGSGWAEAGVAGGAGRLL